MNLFFTGHIEGDFAFFDEEEARHLLQVLRRREGDMVHFVDGRGGYYEGVIAQTAKRSCTVRIEKVIRDFEKRPFFLHIGIAPTKNINRFEWFLEKATEIGVDRITPLLCKHSERDRLRNDRLEKVILAAMKQSLKAFRPQLDELCSWSGFLEGAAGLPAQRYIAYIDEEVKTGIPDNYPPGQDVCILIGPEGDFSPEEVAQARTLGFLPVSLGPSRLRTETAGIVACHTFNFLNQQK